MITAVPEDLPTTNGAIEEDKSLAAEAHPFEENQPSLEFLLQFYDYIEQDLKEGVKIERKSQLVYNNCVMEPVEEDKSIAAEVHPVRRASLFYHNFWMKCLQAEKPN